MLSPALIHLCSNFLDELLKGNSKKRLEMRDIPTFPLWWSKTFAMRAPTFGLGFFFPLNNSVLVNNWLKVDSSVTQVESAQCIR